MKIVSAKFIKSVSDERELFNDGVSEYAFVGRSNVGKSSLINNLCNVKNLAKTSSTPGLTKLINYFDINNGAVRFVDLPGYGYHKAGKKNSYMWSNLIEKYLLKANSLKLVLLLLDIRHTPSELDKIMLSYLLQTGRNFIIVATKADKLSKSAQNSAILNISRTLGVRRDIIFVHSSLNSQGKENILNYIN